MFALFIPIIELRKASMQPTYKKGRESKIIYNQKPQKKR